jgi:hypothetical protein
MNATRQVSAMKGKRRNYGGPFQISCPDSLHTSMEQKTGVGFLLREGEWRDPAL